MAWPTVGSQKGLSVDGVCPVAYWRGNIAVTSEGKFREREQSGPSTAVFRGLEKPPAACPQLLPPVWGDVGEGQALQGVGVGRSCRAARVRCVPEVQVWL